MIADTEDDGGGGVEGETQPPSASKHGKHLPPLCHALRSPLYSDSNDNRVNYNGVLRLEGGAVLGVGSFGDGSETTRRRTSE